MTDEIRGLTSLRFIAAFYVFVFHMHIRWPVTHAKFLSVLLSQGAIGMSIFFMLSGFVLAHRYLDSNFCTKTYFVNRVARIYPIYLVAGLVTLPWFGVPVNVESLQHFAVSLFGILALIIIDSCLLQAWFRQCFDLWNNSGSWSISAEAFFYLVFPLVAGYLKECSRKNVWKPTALLYLLAIVPGITSILFSCSVETSSYFYSSPIFRLSEFLLGVCAFICTKQVRRNSLGRLAYIAWPCCLLYLGLFGKIGPQVYITHSWLVIPTVFFTLLCLSNEKSIASRVLGIKPLVLAGKYSYCFYSFQALLVLLLGSYHDWLVGNVGCFASNIILFFVTFLLLFALSVLGYYFVEEKARHFIRGNFVAKFKSIA